MRIYTKTGDKGQTSLYDSTRVDKDSIRVECYGTIDELNCSLGFAKNFIDNEEVVNEVNRIQRLLFNVAGELATKDASKFPHRVTEEAVLDLERLIDDFMSRTNNTPQFIIPGSSKASGALHMARALCRRAERRIITLNREEPLGEILMKYVNRLSDAIYAMARFLESEIVLVDFSRE